MNDYQSIGKNIPHRESEIKARGKARYASDISRPGTLIAKILFSDRPHALIISIDTQKAKEIEGVKAIITADDFNDSHYGAYLFDRFALAKDKVRYIGEPIAAVAAVDEATAVEALKKIEVIYEDLPPSFSTSESLESTDVLIHPDIDSYQGTYQYIKYDNVCMDAKQKTFTEIPLTT